jgi:precorrin-6B methylase 2
MDLDNQYYVNLYNLFYKDFSKDEYFARGSGTFTSKRYTDYMSKNLLKIFPHKKLNILDFGWGSGLISLPYINLDNVNNIYLISRSSDAMILIKKNILKLKNSKKIITKTLCFFHKIDFELPFDVIIIYSVIHCFYQCSYFENLLNTFTKQLNKHGIIIIGDVPMKKIVLKLNFYIFIFVKNLLINFFKFNINFFFRNLINICEFILRKYVFH